MLECMTTHVHTAGFGARCHGPIPAAVGSSPALVQQDIAYIHVYILIVVTSSSTHRTGFVIVTIYPRCRGYY